MSPPDKPPRERPEGIAEKSWAEYLDRYDRLLDLYAESLSLQVKQQATYARQYDDDLRLRERQARHQRWVGLIGLLFLGGLLVGILIAVSLQAMKSSG